MAGQFFGLAGIITVGWATGNPILSLGGYPIGLGVYHLLKKLADAAPMGASDRVRARRPENMTEPIKQVGISFLPDDRIDKLVDKRENLTIVYRFTLAGIERYARHFLNDRDPRVRAKAEETLRGQGGQR